MTTRETARTNLVRIKSDRRPPSRGDVFAMQVPGGKFRFGRVIHAAHPHGPMPGASLVYIHRWSGQTTEPVYAELRREDLVIPPVWINRLPWTKGYFLTVGNQALTDELVLPRHCFRSGSGRYFDDHGRPLEGGAEPCGQWGLASYWTLDNLVSDALGIPSSSASAWSPSRNRAATVDAPMSSAARANISSVPSSVTARSNVVV